MASREPSWIELPETATCNESSKWHKRQRLRDAAQDATALKPVNVEQAHSDFAVVVQEPGWEDEALFWRRVIETSASKPAAPAPAPAPRKRGGHAPAERRPRPCRGAEDVFVVEEILARQWGADGKMKYLVRWENYGDEENSWIDAKDFVEKDALKILLEKMHQKRRMRRVVT